MSEDCIPYRGGRQMRVFTDEERQLIRDTVFPAELGDRDFDRFMYFCSVRDLDPIEGHCYAQARKNKDTGRYTMSIQTGIDGLRLIADRTGLYAGNDDYEYGPLEGGKPSWARAAVYKVLPGGQLGKFAATARWTEYKPRFNDHMWQAMPHNQLGKCAEALALRKGFPGPLGNIHTDDEMAQADDGDATEPRPVERPVPEPAKTERKPETKLKTQEPGKVEQPTHRREALTPERLRPVFQKKATENKGGDAKPTDGHRGMMVGRLGDLIAGDADAKEQGRHLFLEYMYGTPTSKELNVGQVNAILDWINNDADVAKVELADIITTQLRAKGQLEMAAA